MLLTGVVVGCSSGSPDSEGTSVGADPTTAPSTSITTTTTLPSVPTFETSAAAHRFVFDFDPATGDPATLAAALEVTGVTLGLDIPRLLADGSPEVRGVVLAKLSEPSPWALLLLVAMNEGGQPDGIPWPEATAQSISDLISPTAEATFEDDARIVVDLTRAMLEDRGGIGGEAISGLAGSSGSDTFVGLINLVSDTGESHGIPVRVSQQDGQWILEEGWFSGDFVSRFDLDSPPANDLTIDGSLYFHATCDAGLEVRLNGEPLERIENEGFCYLDGTVDLDPGVNHLVFEQIYAARALATVESVVEYVPDAERLFGYLTEVGDGDVLVDFAEWLTGAEANLAAAEDGVIATPEEGVPNDYYIRNPERTQVAFAIADGTAYVPTPILGDRPPGATRDLGDWRALLDTPMWFYVLDGQVIRIEEQYVP